MSSKDKRLLITTPLDATWKTDRPFTILGRWCFVGEKDDVVNNCNCRVAPYHWDDRELLADDYKMLHDLYEEILLELKESMNRLHGVERSQRFWRILLGPWLGCFIQLAYDRWLSIENIAQEQTEYETTVIKLDASKMIPANMSRFAVMRNDDKWNHYIYGLIAREFPAITINYEQDSHGCSDIEEYSSVLTLDKKNKLLLWGEKLLSTFVRNSDSFFIATYLPVMKLLKLQLSLMQFPIVRSAREISVSYSPSDQLRDWQLQQTSNGRMLSTRFSDWLRKIIPRQVPAVYLEGFKSQLELTKNTHWPSSPKVIWTSVLFHEHDYFKLWVAEKVESGSKLVIGQHGGLYGMAKWYASEDHQVAISDLYLSWGWSDVNRPNIIPVGQLKLLPTLKRERSSLKKVMLVTMELPRYSYSMMSTVVAGQWLNYLQDQYAFINALPLSIRDVLVVRLKYGASAWQTKLGWGAQKRWEQQFPGIAIDPGRGKFYREIMKYQLVIATYNAATYLESMSMNIPTIIFWDPTYWELRDDAVKYLKDLEKVGVFHSTPESAANHLEDIWGDVDGWWESQPVQSAKDAFCRQYSSLPKDMIANIKYIISDLS